MYEAFEQWKQLVRLLCYSEDSLVKHVNLFKGFLSCIHFQLKEVPDDFFVDIVSRNNFLTTTLQVSLLILCPSKTHFTCRFGLFLCSLITIQRDVFVGSNFRVFRDIEPFHEYLTHKHLFSWVEVEQYRSKNEILTHKN